MRDRLVCHCYEKEPAAQGAGFRGEGRGMRRIALPVNGAHLSAVLDFAGKLLVVDIDAGSVVDRREVALGDMPAPSRAQKFRELGVDTVICGAISNPLAAMIAHSGIEIIPGIAGNVEQILAARINNDILGPQHMLPGFCGRGRGGWGRHRRRGHHMRRREV
ncbi:MAG: hypothetical protein GF418_14775 [Chitinivibrionales bacterium]|nr:hypothetical protein [Chitinivibrionales bacterium]MBD3396884.1 hypothetical protein [Chitinivibrionales bacterium]